MKRFFVSLSVIGMILGPLSSISQAGIACSLQEKLGVNNVRECEDYLP